MAGIGTRNTAPEVLLRKALFRKGFRYRLHDRALPGRPDIVLPKWRAVVFVNGCFWHRHPGCRYTTTPATRTEFWASKFDSNVQRDVRNREALARLGWRVATIWECGTRNDVEAVCCTLEIWLRSRETYTLDLPD